MISQNKIKRALISTSNKTNIIQLARFLCNNNIEILSTGGTHKTLTAANIPVLKISDYTGFPEIMNGRVKTLHPKIYGGILARRDIDDTELQQHAIDTIDLVVVNLYPFTQVITKSEHTHSEAIENIDIGGPCMIRAAAKNYKDVVVLTNPDDYQEFMDRFSTSIDEEFCKNLATKAYRHTSAYDHAIAGYLDDAQDFLKDTITVSLTKKQQLRYGENPHQEAAFYSLNDTGFSKAILHQGKQLSYNNLSDADVAHTIVNSLPLSSCAIIKHANPCGVASQSTQIHSYKCAHETDKESAFGGIIAFNNPLESLVAEELVKGFVEVIIAPSYHQDALKILEKKPNIRVISLKSELSNQILEMKRISGGFLVQNTDDTTATQEQMKVSGNVVPTDQQWKDLLFAWQVVRHVKSNAIVYAYNQSTIGIGAGQMSRINSSRIAQIKAEQAGLKVSDCVMASDAFFPFRDSIDAAAQSGIKAIIHPGGSIRDQEIIDAANEHAIALITTNFRHFKH